MYRQNKYNAADESNLFFISDLHAGHDPKWPKPLWAMRGFSSVTEHDETLIKRWNDTVRDDSTIWHLGDFCFNDPDGKRFMSLVRRLRFGRLHLLIGNHTSGQRQAYVDHIATRFPDAVTTDGRLNYEVYPLEMKVDGRDDHVVVFEPEYSEVVINGKKVVLSHYPLASWNEMAKGSWMVHGHEHGSEQRSKIEDVTHGKIIDISIENLLIANMLPMSFRQLRAVMTKKEYVAVGHH